MSPEYGREGILHISEGPTTESSSEEMLSPETPASQPTQEEMQRDLQSNYTDHLKSIENANMEMVRSVVKNAQYGFTASLTLNVASFVLGVVIIIIGLVLLVNSPEVLRQTVGIVSSLLGIALVITLLFWRGPLERILKSAANLAQINAISLGLAHRLNQVSRVFVHQSLRGGVDSSELENLNELVEDSVQDTVEALSRILPKEAAEAVAHRFLSQQNSVSYKGDGETTFQPSTETTD